MTNTWIKVKSNYFTPGGDPIWCCPICKQDEHIMGVETQYNHHNKCENCGEVLCYPWEENNADV